ncbi:MAG: PD40 domain-containing protein [Deltaproteobacteria bacterium]|nr:PD40 domain-containing protein [Deltaproteobacteria bacterium]
MLVLLAAAAVAATYDPDLKWRTIRTEHFDIHFHQGCEQVADELSLAAESIYETMTEEVQWEPRRRTHVVLVDRTDSANGFAGVIPYNAITMYVTAPQEDSNLNFYEDWSDAIFTHELTHILHMDTNHGIVSAARAIVGRAATTNDVSPGWMIEGFATFQETRQTAAGRGRATLADMLMRTSALSDDWPPLGNLDGFQVDPPGGNLRYIYGQDFIQYVSEQTGEDVWTRWVHVYGGHVPFWLPTKKVFGQSLQKLYYGWRDDRRAAYTAVADRVRAEGETVSRVLNADPRASCTAPSFSPDGDRLVWSCSDSRTGNAIWAADGDGFAPEILLDRHGAKTFTWRRDGTAFVYAGMHTVNQFNTFSDVYLHVVGSGSAIPLTAGARARDPDFSPDGSRLIFVTNRAEDNQLQQMTVDRITTPLTSLHDHTQFSTPRFSPDGRVLAVSVHQDGRRDLWLYDTSGKPVRRLTSDLHIDADPAWSADGNWLYFSSDRSGIANIYAIELATERLWQVTNVVTGATRPSIRRDDRLLAWQQWSNDGWEVHVMDVDPAKFIDRGTLPPSMRHPTPLTDLVGDPAPDPAEVASWEVPGQRPFRPGGRAPVLLSAAVAGAQQTSESVDSFDDARAKDVFGEEEDYPFHIAPRRYNPFATLAPTYVLPYIQTTPVPPDPLFRPYTCPATWFCPGLQGSLSTGISDPLRHWAWSAFGAYRTDAADWSAGGALTWNRWNPVFTLSATTTAAPVASIYYADAESPDPADPDLLNSGLYYFERRSVGTFTITWPYQQRASVFARYQYTDRQSTDPIPPDAYAPRLPLRGQIGSLSAGYRYSWSENSPYAISTEDGRIASVVGSLLTPWLGTSVLDDSGEKSGLTQVQLTGEVRDYLTNPWLGNHVFATQLAGGLTFGETQYLGNYSLGGSFGDNAFYVTPEEYRMLRGYPFGYDPGDMYWIASAEYRFPLARFDRGFGTFPLFFRNLSAAAFVDAGNAFDGNFFGVDPVEIEDVFGEPLVGVGAEITLRTVIAWSVGSTLRVGYGVGLTEGGLSPAVDPLAPLYVQLGGAF